MRRALDWQGDFDELESLSEAFERDRELANRVFESKHDAFLSPGYGLLAGGQEVSDPAAKPSHEVEV